MKKRLKKGDKRGGYGRKVADEACNRVPGCIMRAKNPAEVYKKAIIKEQDDFVNRVKKYTIPKEKYYNDHCKLRKIERVIDEETGKDKIDRFDHKKCLWYPSGGYGWKGIDITLQRMPWKGWIRKPISISLMDHKS